MLSHLQALAGGVLLAGIGGEFFLRGIVGLARRWRVSPGLIATTVAAFATSSPELSVALISAWAGEPEISLGDALGSNVVNVALILGLALVISAIPCSRASIRRDFWTALLVPLLLGALAVDGMISRPDGMLLLGIFALWLSAVIREARKQRKAATQPPGERTAPLALMAGIGGLASLLAGGRLVVIGAHGIALKFGIPEFVVGATIVAVGTSAPELATAVIAHFRGHKEVGLGTVLGSNIFNCLWIVGMAAVICPISVAGYQTAVAVVTGILTLVMIFPSRAGTIGRIRGVLLLAAYVIYVVAVLRK